eukprot:CAMPEP_0181370520 /NCGR_PEP_ID=MMETSP1106-20121128/13472_1 /TAXON_ID=81844 /ORGANISM="Mantoniella antarctica, Strain SL-175" /LENGTH=333 /DNA_ID=CAMNT_0023487323 /DNA_START=59 /DNA_END=1060 /DNA_ORIENTATION=+
MTSRLERSGCRARTSPTTQFQRSACNGRCALTSCRAAEDAGTGQPEVGLGQSESGVDQLEVVAEANCRAAAVALVTKHVVDGDRVGVETGRMVNFALEEIHRRLADGTLADVCVVPAGILAAKEAAVAGVPVRSLDAVPALNVTILQVDEVVTFGAPSTGIAAIVGRSQRPVQPDLILIKQVIGRSVKLVLLAEELGDPNPLGGTVPVAIVSGTEWEEVAEELDDTFLGDAEVWRRGAGDANPRGGAQPYVSLDGEHTIVDLKFEDPTELTRWESGMLLFGEEATPYQIAEVLEGTEGVLAHGIVTQADVLFVAAAEEGGEPLVISICRDSKP